MKKSRQMGRYEEIKTDGEILEVHLEKEQYLASYGTTTVVPLTTLCEQFLLC
jgi:hypothetical protein